MWHSQHLFGEAIDVFQSTHPRRVWPVDHCQHRSFISFQSTHPRRVWQWFTLLIVCRYEFQSTHPRRVWLLDQSKEYQELKFQSTHPRRVWLCYLSEAPSCVRFNPHTHAGCDWEADPIALPARVSIHTPTQGVTNSRLSRMHLSKFQSTHPRRVWRGTNIEFNCWGRFNPHTHAGCDSSPRLVSSTSTVSIHTPTQGVT